MLLIKTKNLQSEYLLELTDTSPITFDISREIVVEDIADVRNVDAAGGDVGGDQDVDLTGPEITERLLTVALLPIAVDTLAADAPQGKVRSLQEADDKF